MPLDRTGAAANQVAKGTTDPGIIGSLVSKDYHLDLQVEKVGPQSIKVIVTTNFPDNTNLCVSATRIYFEKGSSERYGGDLFTDDIPVRKGTCELAIPIDDHRWVAEHTSRKTELQKVDLWSEIDSALPEIEVTAMYSSMRWQPEDVQAKLGRKGEYINRIVGERPSGYIGTFRSSSKTIQVAVTPSGLAGIAREGQQELEQHKTGYHLGMTMEGYEFIDEGMSKWQVDTILNCVGVEISSSGSLATYSWRHGFKGLTATFQDGRLISKAQSGL